MKTFSETQLLHAAKKVRQLATVRYGNKSPLGFVGMTWRELTLALDAQCMRDYGRGYIGSKKMEFTLEFREPPPGWPAFIPPGEAFHFTNLVVRRSRMGRYPKHGPASKAAIYERARAEYEAAQQNG